MAFSIPGLQMQSLGDVKADYGRWLLYGPQGAGKSTLASSIARAGRTLYIDMIGEKGTRSFQGASYANNLTIVRPDSITQFDDIFYELNKGNHDFVAVVVDSLTSVQKMTMRYLTGHNETAVREIRTGTAPADQRTWGQALDVMQDTATFWYGLADGSRKHPMHVVMTAQEKLREDSNGNVLGYSPDVQKGALSIMKATPDYVVYLDVEENMDAISDDSLPPVKYIARFGSHPGYSTKARVPVDMRGKIPPILGREKAFDLVSLSRQLGIGGIPAARSNTATNTTNSNTN